MGRMGHGDAMLESISANERKAEADRIRQTIEQQNLGNMPPLSRGFARANNVDTAYYLSGHTPELSKLPKHLFDHSESAPVASTLFNPITAMGYTGEDSAQGEVIDKILQLSGKVYTDLSKLDMIVTIESYTTQTDTEKRYVNYVAVPDFITGGTRDDPYLTKDTRSLGKFLVYLMSKEENGKALITPKEAMDTHGYGFLMSMTQDSNLKEIKDKLGLDFDAAMKKAYEQDPETVSRIVTYRLALGQLTPEGVDQTYGHDVLMQASSKENVNWLRGLTGKTAADLQDTLPNVAKYLEGKAEGRGSWQERG